MKEILFICQGNVGRSQMAEGFYNALVTPDCAKTRQIRDKVKEIVVFLGKQKRKE